MRQLRPKDLYAKAGRDLAGFLKQLAPVRHGLGDDNTIADYLFIRWLWWAQYQAPIDSIELDSLVWAIRWHSFGCPSFSLTDGLTSKLLLTDPGGLRGSDIRFPFPAFMVEVPAGYFSCIGIHAVPQDLRYLSLAHSLGVEGGMTVGFSADIRSFEEIFSKIDELLEIKRDFMSRMTCDMWTYTGYGSSIEQPAIVTQRDHAPGEDERLDEWMRNRDQEAVPIRGAATVDEEETRHLRAMRLLLVNLAIYISTLPKLPHPAVSKDKPRKSRVGGIHTFTLGHQIKLSPELREAARDFSSQARSERVKLRSRFTVRGHWRNQACGPARQDHKRIWIDPYWKGPDVGTQLDRDYGVSE